MREIYIAPQQEGKGREFSATLLSYIEADPLWENGRNAGDTIRPLWMMCAGSEQELRAFVANLRTGRKATFGNKTGYSSYRYGKQERFEILRSSNFQVSWQKEPEGSIVTLYHPELFQIDPGLVDETHIQFVLLPTQAWHSAQTIDTTPIVRHLMLCGYRLSDEELYSLAITSYLFATYLDRRTRCPLVADGRFYAQLMLSCLKHGLASFQITDRHAFYGDNQAFGVHKRQNYYEFDTESVGLLPGIAMSADHIQFEGLLAREVITYMNLVKRRG
jgi:hypothetical protein